MLMRNTFNLEFFRYFNKKNKEQKLVSKELERFKALKIKAEEENNESQRKVILIETACLEMLQEQRGKLDVEFFKQMEEKLPLKEREQLQVKKEKIIEQLRKKLNKKDLEKTLKHKN